MKIEYLYGMKVMATFYKLVSNQRGTHDVLATFVCCHWSQRDNTIYWADISPHADGKWAADAPVKYLYLSDTDAEGLTGLYDLCDAAQGRDARLLMYATDDRITMLVQKYEMSGTILNRDTSGDNYTD